MNAVTLYRPVTIQSALDDFDRILGSFFGESPLAPGRFTGASRHPAVDVRETDDGYILEAELPGYDEKGVLVHVDGKTLTIESAEGNKEGEARGTYVVRERRSTPFSRSFTLPDDADTESVSAAFKNGLLTLEIRKRPEAKRRTVKIEGK